ncbi:MAG: D-aminoacylase, partial [Gemmatimonadetes bacterium]|nr:D-aminoacylase [Gemmatimonadota bacterium]
MQKLVTVLSLLISGCAGDTAASGSTAPRILIEGALVLDGTGAEGVVTDVRVQDGRIQAMGELSA